MHFLVIDQGIAGESIVSLKDVKKRRQEKIRHILKTAKEVFAEKGYAGASTNEIADLAGISKRSMYYYMGDKDTLYTSVIEEMLSDAYKALDFTVESNMNPEEKLRHLILIVAQVGDNPKLHSIVLRELFSGGEFLPKYALEGLDRLFATLKGILEEGKKESGFVDINPFITGMMLLSFFVYWNLIIPYMAEADVQDSEITALGTGVDDQLIDEVHKIFVKLLKK